MTFLVILGFVLFATFAVFGMIDTVYKVKTLSKQHQATLKQIQEEKDKVERERFQYLAGIKLPTIPVEVPDVVEKKLLSELMQETAIEFDLHLEEMIKTSSKKYTRR